MLALWVESENMGDFFFKGPEHEETTVKPVKRTARTGGS